MANRLPLRQIEQHFKQVLIYAPGMLGNDAVNFFLDRFKSQSWLGETNEPWQKRKTKTKWGKTPRNNGRAILVDTGRLRRSIRIISAQFGKVVIGSSEKYARAHNEGLRLGFIQQVKQYQRKKLELGIKAKTTYKKRSNIKFGMVDKGGKTTVRAHKRRINMKLPRRQFMGNSPYLAKQLSRKLQAELMKGLR